MRSYKIMRALAAFSFVAVGAAGALSGHVDHSVLYVGSHVDTWPF